MAVRLSPVMVGRDDLVALAGRRWRTACEGHGHLLFLSGEAGIGKSRLLGEIARALGVPAVRAGAYPGDADPAGSMLVELAVELRRLRPEHPAGERMRHRLRQGPEPGEDPGRRRRLLIADLVTELAEPASAGPPVLLALEDLHWADELTLDVLDRLALRLPELPMLVIGTYRSDELYPKVPLRRWRTRLLSQRLAEEAKLTRLTPAQTAQLCSAIAGDVLPTAFVEAVHRRSDGIPLHVEEFLGGTDPQQPDAVPETLAEAVLLRAQSLTPQALQLVRAASVLGRTFTVDLLTPLTPDSDARTVDAALGELVDRFFLQHWGDSFSYVFRHALIRDALYADLPPLYRRELHATVAERAVAAGLPEAFVSDHFERAQRPGEAYRHALAAAAEAMALSAHRDAVELFRRAQRTTPTATLAAERADLLAALGEALATADDNEAADAAYAQAHALRLEIGDRLGAARLVPPWVAVRHLLGHGLDARTGLLKTTVDDPAAQAVRPRLQAALASAYMLDRRLDEALEHGYAAKASATEPDLLDDVDATLGAVLVFAGRMDEGWRLMADAVERAVEARRETQAARAYRMIGSCASVLVEYPRADRYLREGVAYAERIEMWNDRHYMASHLAHVLWATGDLPTAQATARQALADGRGGITTRITALHVLGYVALGRREWDNAREHLLEALALGEEMLELQRISPALWGLAELELHSGRPDDAIVWCDRGYTASAAVDDAAYLFPFVVTGVRAHLERGDSGGAREWLGRTEKLLRLRDIPGTRPALAHARGLIHLAAGQTGKARPALDEASAGWDERNRVWEGTQALLDRARCAARSRRPTDEARLVQAAAARGIPLWEKHSDLSDPGPLTPRELEVAGLIASGATNREIAECLHVAPKTVAAHVEHILTKLGAARRTEIATWVTMRRR